MISPEGWIALGLGVTNVALWGGERWSRGEKEKQQKLLTSTKTEVISIEDFSVLRRDFDKVSDEHGVLRDMVIKHCAFCEAHRKGQDESLARIERGLEHIRAQFRNVAFKSANTAREI